MIVNDDINTGTEADTIFSHNLSPRNDKPLIWSSENLNLDVNRNKKTFHKYLSEWISRHWMN